MNAYAPVIGQVARSRLMPFVMLAFSHLHHRQTLKPAWYLQAMCWALEKVERGDVLRFMIWLMPRALKSQTVAVAFPCWALGRDPTITIMIATYSDRLSIQHADARRQIMSSPWYKTLFPGTEVLVDRQLEMKTTKGGKIISVSVTGTMTGMGADIIILDDCMNAADRNSSVVLQNVKLWYDGALATRINSLGTGRIVSIQQRLSEDDLPAHLLDRGFECLSLPAIAERDEFIEIGPGLIHHRKRGDLLDPVRFSQRDLDLQRLNLDKQDYHAQYQQRPVAPDGNLLKMDQIRRFSVPIPRENFEKIIQSWDCAASDAPTAAYSVGLTFGLLAGRLFLLEIYRRRVDFPDLRNAIITARQRWRADYVLIEEASAGIGLISSFRREGPFKPTPIKLDGKGKAERLTAQTGQIAEGRLWFPAELEGLETLLAELRAFPGSKYSDQVDALTQALKFAMDKWRRLATEYTPSGRPIDLVRTQLRPPVPPLPSWIK